MLADFATVTAALSCAWAIQRSLVGRNTGLPFEPKVEFRIGVNLGEALVDRDDIYADGVNVAARLGSLVEPGGISVSKSVRSSAAASGLALASKWIDHYDEAVEHEQTLPTNPADSRIEPIQPCPNERRGSWSCSTNTRPTPRIRPR